jgi:hypothetical protein
VASAGIMGAMLSDQAIRNYIYGCFREWGRPPTVSETAEALGGERAEVAAAYRSLHEGHAIFLEPGGGEPRVRMAHPFSAVPTPFRVHTKSQSYFANCAWDMLGILAALHSDGVGEARCGDCGEGIRVEVADGRLVAGGEVAHFLVPFGRWYEDLVHT